MGRHRRDRSERDRSERGPHGGGVDLERPDPVRARYPRGPGGWHYGGLGYRPEPPGGMQGVPEERPRGRPPKNYHRANDRLREDVCDALTEDSQLDATNVEVDVERGVVSLRGQVPDRASKRRAEAVVEWVRGVEDVNNELRIAPPSEPAAVQRASDASGTRSTNGNGERRR